jgi:hypothetical protein
LSPIGNHTCAPSTAVPPPQHVTSVAAEREGQTSVGRYAFNGDQFVARLCTVSVVDKQWTSNGLLLVRQLRLSSSAPPLLRSTESCTKSCWNPLDLDCQDFGLGVTYLFGHLTLPLKVLGARLGMSEVCDIRIEGKAAPVGSVS